MMMKMGGIALANRVAAAALVKTAKDQKKLIGIEHDHIENIKDATGYDFRTDQFLFNKQIYLGLEQRRMGATKIPTMLEKKTMISQMNASRISRAGIGRAKEQRACCADYRRAKYFIQKVQER